MPDWLVQILIQYPIVVIVGFVAWYAHQKIEKVMESRVRREETLHTSSIEKLEKAQKDAIAETKNDFDKLKIELRSEFKKLGKRIDELDRRHIP
jgi:hypothetical protein